MASSLCGEVPVNDRACLKRKGGGTLKNDTGSGPMTYKHSVVLHTLLATWTDKLLHTLTGMHSPFCKFA